MRLTETEAQQVRCIESLLKNGFDALADRLAEAFLNHAPVGGVRRRAYAILRIANQNIGRYDHR